MNVSIQSSSAAMRSAGPHAMGGAGAMRPPPGPPPDAAKMSEDFMSTFDTDSSGSVDKTELASLLKDRGVTNADEIADQMITDLGGSDGSISKQQVQDSFDAQRKQMESRVDALRVSSQVKGHAGAGSDGADGNRSGSGQPPDLVAMFVSRYQAFASSASNDASSSLALTA